MLLSFILSLLLVQCLSKVKSDYKFNLKYLEKLQSAAKNGYIEINQEQFKKFSMIEHENRGFNLFVLFISLDPSMGCAACP
jgi:hypothetical protein